ncbi:trypsin-like serine peptidase [Rhizobium sp. P28RR-XV]|uniref:trypsin-like serine peptidase n=1 Tax=Rhizobium sp. P28RR-XV TaxID=2726737 RepID=UPI00145649A1|nr:trypsin-like serine protease [Rhizobium sp. P28RR-XV]NLR89545.1 trypsin-like serine protease [Rhizobium sp. P28RR-XV]
MSKRESSILALLWLVTVRLATVILAILLPGCGGFESYKYSGSNDDILFIVNTAPPFTAARYTQVTPLNLPHIPPGSPAGNQRPLPKGLTPEIVVPPFHLEPLVKPKAADGQVEVADLTKTPYKAAGRLDFNFPSDAPGWGHLCTGQFIGSAGVILTAAHCVWDQPTRAWGTNFQFLLRYDHGPVAQTFDWQCAAIVSGWPNGSYAYDFAFIKVRGVPEQGIGMEINVGATHVDAMGYPSNYESNERLYHVSGYKDGGNPARMPNPLSHGASGGAWVSDNLTAVSVNSFKYTDDESRMYGPALSKTTLHTYEFVARGCRDQVSGLGSSTSIDQSGVDSSKADTVVTLSNRDLSSGARLETAASDSCGCDGAGETLLVNDTEDRQLIGVQEITSNSAIAKSELGSTYLVLQSKERKSLGCNRRNDAQGNMCSVDYSYRVASTRAVSVDNPSMPKAVPGISIASALAIQDVNSCVMACSNHDNAKCLDLGPGGIAALGPLGEFVETVDGASGAPEGVLIVSAQFPAPIH